jgi:phage terminase small subunit
MAGESNGAHGPEEAGSGESGAREKVILTPQQRRELLGKLAEFEIALLNLPPREQAFVLAMIMDPRSKRGAALKAGVPERSADVRAQKFLAMPRVAHAIALGNNVREDRTMVTSDRTIHEMAIIAFADVNMFEVKNGNIGVRDGVPEYMTRAIQSVDLHEEEFRDAEGKVVRVERRMRLRLWSKTDTLRMLALYQKLISNALVGSVTIDNRQLHINQWKFGDRLVQF